MYVLAIEMEIQYYQGRRVYTRCIVSDTGGLNGPLDDSISLFVQYRLAKEIRPTGYEFSERGAPFVLLLAVQHVGHTNG